MTGSGMTGSGMNMETDPSHHDTTRAATSGGRIHAWAIVRQSFSMLFRNVVPFVLLAWGVGLAAGLVFSSAMWTVLQALVLAGLAWREALPIFRFLLHTDRSHRLACLVERLDGSRDLHGGLAQPGRPPVDVERFPGQRRQSDTEHPATSVLPVGLKSVRGRNPARRRAGIRLLLTAVRVFFRVCWAVTAAVCYRHIRVANGESTGEQLVSSMS